MKIHALWYENYRYLGIKTLITTFLRDSTLHVVRVIINSYYLGIKPFCIVMMALGYRNPTVYSDMKIHAVWYGNHCYLGIKTLITTFLWDLTLHVVQVTIIQVLNPFVWS